MSHDTKEERRDEMPVSVTHVTTLFLSPTVSWVSRHGSHIPPYLGFPATGFPLATAFSLPGISHAHSIQTAVYSSSLVLHPPVSWVSRHGSTLPPCKAFPTLTRSKRPCTRLRWSYILAPRALTSFPGNYHDSRSYITLTRIFFFRHLTRSRGFYSPALPPC